MNIFVKYLKISTDGVQTIKIEFGLDEENLIDFNICMEDLFWEYERIRW